MKSLYSCFLLVMTRAKLCFSWFVLLAIDEAMIVNFCFSDEVQTFAIAWGLGMRIGNETGKWRAHHPQWWLKCKDWQLKRKGYLIHRAKWCLTVTSPLHQLVNSWLCFIVFFLGCPLDIFRVFFLSASLTGNASDTVRIVFSVVFRPFRFDAASCIFCTSKHRIQVVPLYPNMDNQNCSKSFIFHLLYFSVNLPARSDIW